MVPEVNIMFFKPRIFISSLLQMREEIKAVIEGCGATALLYEKDLTPSINAYTYRKDILDADFIIVILDEKYGATTSSGMSGTEEEYNLATENKQNVHVYIKNTKESDLDEKQNDFLNKIKKSGASYYIYEDESDLIKRIKESVMSIAKEIAVSKLSKNDIDEKTLKKIAFEHDYEIAIGIAAIYQTFRKILDEEFVDYLYSDIALEFFDSIYYWVKSNTLLFNDHEFYSLCLNALTTIKEFIHKHAMDFTTTTRVRNYFVPKKGNIEIISCKANNPRESIDIDWYQTKMREFYTKFNAFIEYIKNKKYDLDTYFVE